MRTLCLRASLCSLLFACGTVEQRDLGGSDPGGKSDKGDDSAPDAGVEATYEGTLSLITHTNLQTATGTQTYVSGVFGKDIGFPILAEAGGCTLSAAPNPQAILSAGDIQVTGGSAPITLSLVSDTYNFMADDAMFAAGSTLTVSASGDAAPGFTADVTVPERLGAVQIPASVSRAAGATLTWTPGGAATAIISFVFESGNELRLVRCLTPDSGSFTLSPQAITLLPADIQQAQISAAHYNELIVKPNASWSIAVQAGDVSGPTPTFITIVP
ncbi:MAG: hypothetical protein AB7O24_04755 [Kofleriaceae bacterium]